MATIEAAVEPDIQLSEAELDDIVGGAAPATVCCGCVN